MRFRALFLLPVLFSVFPLTARESASEISLSLELYYAADFGPQAVPSSPDEPIPDGDAVRPAEIRLMKTDPDGKAGLFASIPIPPETIAVENDGGVTLRNDTYSLTVSPGKEEPFFLLEAEPIGGGPKPLDKITLPPIRYKAAAERLRAFGTGGLTPLGGRRGSYAFLGLVDPETNAGLLAGWLTSRHGSGVFFCGEDELDASITGQIDYGAWQVPEKAGIGEVMVLGVFDDLRDGLEAYGDALARWNGVRLKPAPCGYCTWYSDKNGGCGSEETTAEFAKIAAEKLVPFGMTFFQIDDGWQLGAGTNGPRKNFTSHDPKGPYHSGLKETADRLGALGLTTGIWFMPFSGNYDDPWYSDRQDLFVRSAIDYPSDGEKNTRRFPSIDQKKGAPYETFWGGTCLDMSNPKTRQYVTDEVNRIVRDWNCRYFKIDGMWTGAGIEQLYVNDEYLPDDIGKQKFFDPALSNMEVYRLGLETVRKAAGDGVFILGCNVSQNMRVMNASIGFVDAMRIGPDNGASWEGICRGPWRATNRYFYNGRVWWNDPDPVYVRDEIPLSHAQTITSWAAISGQLYAFSDWLPDLSDERINVLRRTMPNHQRKTARPVDLFTSDLARVWVLTDPAVDGVRPARYAVGIFNWNENQAESFRIPAEKLGLEKADSYAVYDFWGDRFITDGGPGVPVDVTVPPASCLILAIRPITDSRPILLSTSRHVTQGILDVDVEFWNPALPENKMPDTAMLGIGINPEKSALTEELPYQLRVWRPGPAEEIGLAYSVPPNMGPCTIEPEPAGNGTLYRITLPRIEKFNPDQKQVIIGVLFPRRESL